MLGGVARSYFLAFLVSVAVAALDQSNSLDLKHLGLASSGESSLSSDAETQYNPLIAAPDLNSNKLSSSGANQYGASHQSYKTHDFQGRPLGIDLHEPSDNANQLTEEDEALRSAAFASAKGNSAGGGSSAFSTVQGQGDSSARALSGGSGLSSALGQADTSGGYSSSQANAFAQALSGAPIPYGSSLPGAGYPGDGYGSTSAQADAQTFYGGSSPYGTGYPGSGSGGGYGSAQVLGDASTQAINTGSIPYGSGYPGLGSPGGGYGSARAQADASAHAQNGGSSPYGLGYPSSRYLGGEYASAQAQADASAQGLIGGPSPYGSGYPGSAYDLTQPQTDTLGSSSAQTDASAQAISGGSSPFGFGYPVLSYPSLDYPSTRYNSAQAQADASAQTLGAGLSPSNSEYPSSGYPIPSYSSTQTQADASSGYGNGQTQTDALAEALSGGSVPYNSGYPGTGGPGSAISSAQANADVSSVYGSGLTQAEALAQALSPYQPGLPSSNVVGSGYASAQAQADASAQALGESFSPSRSVYPNYLPNGGYSSAQAEADASSGYGSAQAHADAIARTLGGGSSPFGSEYNSAQAQANAAAQAAGSSSAHASSSASAFSRLRSRVIPQQEIIYPDQIPGGNNVITCSREGELHNLWSASFDCMVCTCIRQYGSLVPLCASCSGCQGFNPTPQPPPPQPPLPWPPQPRPLPQVTCDPLPRNQFFQNPLNPCQTCICNPLVEFGVPEVRIMCQEKPECILPPDAPVIPAIPDVPVPLPQCERFPQNVMFPHPSDYCRLCRCFTQKTLFGIPEQHIECIPNPECNHGPPPLPPPFPPPSPPPQPQPQVSCAPLPTDQFFQNPLNPCQICVCKPLNVFGLPDVRITCQDNPQCVLPPDAPVIPPIPDIPVPLPLCERFPQNVMFPHPSDVCRLCKCVTRLSVTGIPEQHIECLPNPECENRPPFRPPTPVPFFPPDTPFPPEPIYPPQPFPPSPEPRPFSPEIDPLPPAPYPQPLPFVPSIRPKPVPWPPRPGPGPLPGPAPHESCLPYTPNIPFQHPWDECQVCMCSESHVVGLVSIEVDCYTKPSCCVEPPVGPLPLPGPLTPPVTPNPIAIQILDLICEFKTFAVQFLHPKDPCKKCSCEIFGRFVIPVCQRLNKIECSVLPAPIPNNQVVYIEPKCRNRVPYKQFVINCNLCVCQSAFNYVVAKCKPEPNCYPNDLRPTRYPLYGPEGGFSHASAEANAVAQNQPGHQYGVPGLPGTQYLIPAQVQSGGGTASAGAHAQAFTTSYPSGPGQPGNQYFIPGQPSSNYVIPGQHQPGGGTSTAEAEAQAIFGNYPSRPGQYGNQYLIQPGSLNFISGQPDYQYAIPGQLQPGGGYSSALSGAQASTGNYPSLPSQPGSQYVSPGQLQPGSGYSSAEAEARAISGNYLSIPGQFGNQYSIPGPPKNQYLIPGQPGYQYLTPGQLQPGGGYSSAEAQAQAISGIYPSRPGQPGNQYSIPSQPGGQNVIPGQLQNGGGYSSASAEAQAVSGSYSSGPTYPYQGPGYEPAYGSTAANAQASANAIAKYNPNKQFNSGLKYPEPLSSSYANAEALASANEQQPYYIPGVYVTPTTPANPSYFPQKYYPGEQSGAQATADANASSNTGAAPALYPSPSNENSYPYTPFDYPGSNQGGYSSGQAQAQASARAADGGLLMDNNPNSQNNNYLPLVSQGFNAQYPTNYDPNYSQNGNAYPVSNEANAEAETVAASDMYPSMYPRPSSQKTPLYVPGQNGWDRGSTPQTSPLLHGDTSAQSLAQAQAQVQAGSA